MINPGTYVNTPVKVEAIRWDRDMAMRKLMDFTNDLVKLNDVTEEFFVYDRLHDTWVKFQYGDYIIKGVKGEFYPVYKDVFEETYRQCVEKEEPEEEVVYTPDIGGNKVPMPRSVDNGYEINIYPSDQGAESIAQQLRRENFYDPSRLRA